MTNGGALTQVNESIALWWIRRDLRMSDNQALSTALDRADTVIPVFVLDPALLNSSRSGEKRLAFMYMGLQRLDAALRIRGSQLIVRRGDPAEALEQLVRETGARWIVAEEDISPYARTRDQQVSQTLPLQHVGGLLVHPPGAVRRADGGQYTVFTPFSRAWRFLPMPVSAALWHPPDRLPPVPSNVLSESIPRTPALTESAAFVPGEEEANRRLVAFFTGCEGPWTQYAAAHNRMDQAGTSGLSPYLRFGMVSARRAAVQAVDAAQRAPNAQARKAADTWLTELIWREFYAAILFHFPHVRLRSFRPAYDAIPWRNCPSEFDAWCAGQTGYPVVDAAMRQLASTGWMHNRARMIVASFLVKDLLIDWRWGERWFMSQLIDGDPASNNGGWQWTAGTGTDAAPYFRIFNPVLQGQRHDPAGEYVRQWVPELASVPNEFVHQPWRMPTATQSRAGCLIGRDYPKPMVNHETARDRVLAAYSEPRAAL